MIAVKWLDFPPNHNKQTCKMFPNNNHGKDPLRLRGFSFSASVYPLKAIDPLNMIVEGKARAPELPGVGGPSKIVFLCRPH